jgi:hypothetical protein
VLPRRDRANPDRRQPGDGPTPSHPHRQRAAIRTPTGAVPATVPRQLHRTAGRGLNAARCKAEAGPHRRHLAVGRSQLRVPRVLDGGFQPTGFARYPCSEQFGDGYGHGGDGRVHAQDPAHHHGAPWDADFGNAGLADLPEPGPIRDGVEDPVLSGDVLPGAAGGRLAAQDPRGGPCAGE